MTSSENPMWVCLSINQNAIREGDLLQLLKKEMLSIFKEDMCEMVILCDKLSKEIFEMNVENYLFVKVKNYFNYVKALKDSNVIFGVLDSYDSPSFISESEVYKFRDSLKHKFNTDELKNGDVVQIKEGFLKNLKGVVIDKINETKYKVMFKFHTHSMVETMYRKNLVYVSNIFDVDHIKERYTSYIREVKTNENKLRRTKSRKYKSKKQR